MQGKSPLLRNIPYTPVEMPLIFEQMLNACAAMLQNGVYGFRLSGDYSQQKIFRNTHEAMEKEMKRRRRWLDRQRNGLRNLTVFSTALANATMAVMTYTSILMILGIIFTSFCFM